VKKQPKTNQILPIFESELKNYDDDDTKSESVYMCERRATTPFSNYVQW